MLGDLFTPKADDIIKEDDTDIFGDFEVALPREDAVVPPHMHRETEHRHIVGHGSAGCVYKPPFRYILPECVNSRGSTTDRC
jgi:hypothetical protein